MKMKTLLLCSFVFTVLSCLTCLKPAHAEYASVYISPRIQDFNPEIAQYYAALGVTPSFEKAASLTPAQHAGLDKICKQKDCAWSLLKWETSLEEAKKIAALTHKPILSLRMLGDLSQDLSCANSRFFRTALYSDPAISKLMRENFVIHWSSESDVPIAEIRFPSGKVVRTTVTGNSVHYILDQHGQVVDALPGMTTPGLFKAFLQKTLAAKPYLMSAPELRRFQEANVAETQAFWMLQSPRAASQADRIRNNNRNSWVGRYDDTMSKIRIEAPILKEVLPDPKNAKQPSMQDYVALMEKQDWEKIAKGPAFNPLLSTNSKQLIRSKLKDNSANFEKIITRFSADIAADAARNLYSLQTKIRNHIATTDSHAFEDLNAWVYDQVFLAKVRDPEMGMINRDVFTGLDNNGIL